MLTTGCGPSPEEVAGTVLGIAPFAYFVTLYLLSVLVRAWARASMCEPLEWTDWKTPWRIFGLSFVCFLGWFEADPSLLPWGLWLVTGVCAAAGCLLARVAVAIGSPRLIPWSAVAVLAVVAASSAAVFVLDNEASQALADGIEAVLWVGGRWLGPALVIAVILEAAIRLRRSANRAAA